MTTFFGLTCCRRSLKTWLLFSTEFNAMNKIYWLYTFLKYPESRDCFNELEAHDQIQYLLRDFIFKKWSTFTRIWGWVQKQGQQMARYLTLSDCISLCLYLPLFVCLCLSLSLYIYIYINICWVTEVEDDLKSPFSIATILKCRRGRNVLPWISLYHILLSVKQCSIKYYFLRALIWLNLGLNPGFPNH